MDYIGHVQRGIDYIEEHLNEDIELAAVSRVAGVSHWHFQRMFRALTGKRSRPTFAPGALQPRAAPS